MARGFFVTGTDTGVGKTVVSAALMHYLRARGPAKYWKPIQTGIEQDDDTAEVARLGACSGAEIRADGVRLPRPLSPHLSARLAGVTIDVTSIQLPLDEAASDPAWVVEGAGGVFVPIDDRTFMVDLMEQCGLPVLIAARSALGTINHTTLTVEALRRRGLDVAGVVMVGARNAENVEAIEQYAHVAVVGELPMMTNLTPAALGTWARKSLDPAGRLERMLR